MFKEPGNFKGGDTTTASLLRASPRGTFGYVSAGEIRLDNADLIVLPSDTVIHRTPPADPYVRVEREYGLLGKLHGLPAEGLEKPQQIRGERGIHLAIDVGDDYYDVWDPDLEADLRR